MFDTLYTGQKVRAFSVDLASYYLDATKLNPSSNKRALDYSPNQYALTPAPNAIQAISSGDSAQSNRPKQGLGDLFLQVYTKLQSDFKYIADPGVGGPWGSLSWTSRCKEINKITYSSSQKIKTSYPVLVLNTEYDHVTPYISAQANAGFFENSILIKTDEFGVSFKSIAKTRLTIIFSIVLVDKILVPSRLDSRLILEILVSQSQLLTLRPHQSRIHL